MLPRIAPTGHLGNFIWHLQKCREDLEGKLLTVEDARRESMWREELLAIVRELDAKNQAEMGLELLEAARVILAEVERVDASLLRASRCPEFCAECPFLKLSDR